MPDQDNKLRNAKHLGGLGSAPLSKSDRLSPTDLDDLYRFSLERSSSIELSLIAKGGKASIELYALKGSLSQAIGRTDFRKLRGKNKKILQLVSASRRGDLPSGEYFVRVLQRKGSSSYEFKLSALPIDTQAPNARVRITNFVTDGNSTYDFAIEYSDNIGIDVNSLDNNDIQVTGPNGFAQLATLVSANDFGATYRINAPGGSWDFSENGSYNIALQGNQVRDGRGNTAAASILSSFLVNIGQPPLADTTAPTASINGANILTSGGTTYDFTVTYSDNVAVDASSFDNSDIQVTGAGGFSQIATRVSVHTSSGNSQTVTYRITAPGGAWDSADNGSYSVALQANQVSDTSGNFAAATNLGNFLADFPRRTVNFSGGSNGPYYLRLTLDSSVLDTDSDPTKGFFPNAIQSVEVSDYNFPQLIVNFGSASITSFEAEVPVIESSDLPSVRRTLYQATFTTVNLKRTSDDRDFLVDTLTFLVGPLSQDDNFVNSLSPLDAYTRTEIEVPVDYGDGILRTTNTAAYTIVLTNGPTISRTTTTPYQGNWFSNIDLS